jgi:hypothetical protein
MAMLEKIVSGGQTGVDQGALKAAVESSLECGGWCPPDRRSERGPIPSVYGLQPTARECSPGKEEVPRSERTEWNVFCSDATIILRPSDWTKEDAGTKWTEECADRYGRRWKRFDPFKADCASRIIEWLNEKPPLWLNVAGPSESNWRGIEEQTCRVLKEVIRSQREMNA